MRILTYNCCALPVLTGELKARLTRIGSEIASLDPDVVLLQEVFLPRHLRILRDGLARWRYAYSGVRAWRTFGGGLAVFSKHPLAEPGFVRFRDQGQLLRYSLLARVSRKGFITAIVEPEGAPPFRLVATHPIADYRVWRSGPALADARGAKTMREYLWKKGAVIRGDPYPVLQGRQMAQLTAYLTGLEPGLPLVVGGDFNLTPVSRLMRDFLRATGLCDCMGGSLAPSIMAERYYRLPYHGAPDRRIDYILLRGGRSGRFVPREARYVLERPVPVGGSRSVTLSDHLGVLVELDWSEGAARLRRGGRRPGRR